MFITQLVTIDSDANYVNGYRFALTIDDVSRLFELHRFHKGLAGGNYDMILSQDQVYKAIGKILPHPEGKLGCFDIQQLSIDYWLELKNCYLKDGYWPFITGFEKKGDSAIYCNIATNKVKLLFDSLQLDKDLTSGILDEINRLNDSLYYFDTNLYNYKLCYFPVTEFIFKES